MDFTHIILKTFSSFPIASGYRPYLRVSPSVPASVLGGVRVVSGWLSRARAAGRRGHWWSPTAVESGAPAWSRVYASPTLLTMCASLLALEFLGNAVKDSGLIAKGAFCAWVYPLLFSHLFFFECAVGGISESFLVNLLTNFTITSEL